MLKAIRTNLESQKGALLDDDALVALQLILAILLNDLLSILLLLKLCVLLLGVLAFRLQHLNFVVLLIFTRLIAVILKLRFLVLNANIAFKIFIYLLK